MYSTEIKISRYDYYLLEKMSNNSLLDEQSIIAYSFGELYYLIETKQININKLNEIFGGEIIIQIESKIAPEDCIKRVYLEKGYNMELFDLNKLFIYSLREYDKKINPKSILEKFKSFIKRFK